MHLYIYTHTGAGTIGDNELEAITAVKWSRTDVIYIHIYRLLHVFQRHAPTEKQVGEVGEICKV